MQIDMYGDARIVAGVSERGDGSMVWWNRKPVDQTIQKNRDAFFTRKGIHPNHVASGGSAHGNAVATVSDAQAGQYILNTDGLITNTTGLFLTVTVADCLPIFFFDPKTRSIGIAHAGWRGIVGGITEAIIENMARAFDSHPEDLVAVIGPHIQQHHYPVNEEVAQQFSSLNIRNEHDQMLLDLGSEARDRLHMSGVKQVTVDETCTYCSASHLFSARHDKCDPLQGAVAYIGLPKL